VCRIDAPLELESKIGSASLRSGAHEEAADCLYGVTMQPGGSSRVVSEKVKS